MKVYFKILNISIIACFLGLLLLPTINDIFHLIKEEEGTENRTKFQKPVFVKDSVEKYAKDYDSYYTDNFNLRNNFIRTLNKFEFSFFDSSPIPDEVVVGKHGWFYLKNCAPNYKGLNLFSEKEMIAYKAELITRTKWAAERGIKYYVAVVPNKMNIYPEYLPNQIIKVSEKTRYDQIVALDSSPFINVIDVRENLLKHKNEGYYLYQHTDDHWNELGAYYGYQAIMNRLAKDFPELSPSPISDFKIEIEKRVGNMAKMLNAEENYSENFVKLTERNKTYGRDGTKRGYTVPKRISDWDYEIIKVTDNRKKLKCLIIRDSFTLLMIKYLQEHFKESVFIHGEWEYKMHEELILKEKPNIILNIILETGLDKLIEFPFTPSIYENQINLMASNNKYICTESKDRVVANRDYPGAWETYTLIKLTNTECALLAYNNFFLSANLNGNKEISAHTEKLYDWEKFTLISLDDGYVAFKAANGKYLSFDEKTKQIFAIGNSIGKNEKFKLARLTGQ